MECLVSKIKDFFRKFFVTHHLAEIREVTAEVYERLDRLDAALAEHSKQLKDFQKINESMALLLDNATTDRHKKIEDYRREYLFADQKYHDSRKLNSYERQIYSENGEDGIISEIFKRIGTTKQFFVEFGAQNGLFNNTSLLLFQDWKGLWLEADSDNVQLIRQKFGGMMTQKKLTLKEGRVTAENIEDLFDETGVSKEFDLLSVDIDGNDYWVWKSLERYSPRVVVIEYNAFWGPEMKWVMKYDPDYVWRGTSYFGASLKSLELLGTGKGYELVGCDFNGTNAFFVRKDLIEDKFLPPFTAKNHYEPARPHLVKPSLPPKDVGEFVSL